jgi:CubicO group peptidase (beta-lactamase class C family)
MPDPIATLARDPERVAAAIGPDAAVAAAAGGRITTAGSSAVLRPGSTTKLLTATAAMQCVDDGLLTLDTPAARFVPSVDPRVTLAHLLSHSSGIDAADVFLDTGDGDDALTRYLEILDGAGQLFEPGRTFSYNNAGMVLAGHLVASVRDAPFEDVVARHILEPADMTSAAFVPANDGNPMCTRALAPAGGTLACTAEDLVRFARAPLVRPETLACMRTMHAPAPGGVVQMAGCGLG